MTEEIEFLRGYLKDADAAGPILSLARYIAERGQQVPVTADMISGGRLSVIYSPAVGEWTIHTRYAG
jgi:hypothetical protein